MVLERHYYDLAESRFVSDEDFLSALRTFQVTPGMREIRPGEFAPESWLTGGGEETEERD